jgi:hypothetical protein
MADYSCYIRIKTSASVPTFSITNPIAVNGDYVKTPPTTIAPGSTVNFQLQDKAGPYGSEGGFECAADGGACELKLSYADPCGVDTDNSGSATVGPAGAGFVLDIWSATGDDPWKQEPVPTTGHPVWFFVGVRQSDEPALTPD